MQLSINLGEEHMPQPAAGNAIITIRDLTAQDSGHEGALTTARLLPLPAPSQSKLTLNLLYRLRHLYQP